MYFGQCEKPHCIACRPTQFNLWAPNYSHPTFISGLCSTSPCWWVQRLSHDDWLSLQYTCVYTCVCITYTPNTVPIDYCYVPCCEGRACFTFLKCGWNSTLLLLQPPHQAALKTATSPVYRDQGGRFDAKVLTAAHLVYLANIQFWPTAYTMLPGDACMTFRWKIHFT